jgi:hypothetical protein
MDCQPE